MVMNTQNIIFSLFIIVVILAGCSQQPTPSASPSASSGVIEIEISNFNYAPSSINVKVGDTIRWTNKDIAPHTVTSESGSELSSQTLNIGQSYSHTFSNTGTYPYYCTFHPNMKGQVNVS